MLMFGSDDVGPWAMPVYQGLRAAEQSGSVLYGEPEHSFSQLE
jgi:hypothetical protein